MARPDLGTKWQCQNCSAKFYDLGRSPAVCPKCGTEQQPAAPAPRSRPEAARPRAEAVPDTPSPEVELISLEEAEESAEGGAVPAAKVDIDAEDDVGDGDDAAADDTFLEEDEEDEDNVARLIDGDLDEDEEG